MKDSYHFIGIGGIGMSGLARLLLEQKITVTGSDIAFNAVIEGLIKEGATIYKGQAAENIPLEAKVVYTSDVKADNPEYQAAIKMQSALLHRSDLLAELMKNQQPLAVAGTHGKTTTSALLATTLVDAGLDPSFAIGGMLPAFQSNARFGKGEWFAFEADESDRSFLKYHPFGAIVTNIGQDHLNNYEGSFDLLIENFKLFMSQVQAPPYLFWCRDDAHLTRLNFPGQSYGFDLHSDWRVTSMRQEGFRVYFDLEHQKQLYSQIEVALVGRHNVLNAAAVFGLSITLGVPEASIRHTFKNFKGVLRRCENKGTAKGVLFIDDYAHHPTEIQTTLKGIKQAVASRRVLAVFQPHRYTRTQDCLGSYGKIFEDVDEVLVTDIYAAGEAPIPHLSSAIIQQEIQQHSTVPCRYIPRSALSHFLTQFVQPYDVVVALGAGDITKLGSETLSLLEKEPQRYLKIGWILDDQFKGELPVCSFPYLQFCEFGIAKNGRWVTGKNVLQQLESEAQVSLEGQKELVPLSIIQQLLECDVFISLVASPQEGSLQGFLEILGKPYVKNVKKIVNEEIGKGIEEEIEKLVLNSLQEKRWKDRQSR